MTEQTSSADEPVVAGWRFKLGVVLFLISLIGPLVALPVVTALGLSAAMTATVSGFILGGAEVLTIAAAAVMGKRGFAYLKGRIFGLLKQYGPPAEVGRGRYRIGLVLFFLPIVFGWVMPYAADVIPGLEANLMTYAIIGDLLLLIGLFVLGGDFWDKLCALFIHGAKAVFPSTTAGSAAEPQVKGE
jgi:hypothetical protein